MFEDNRTVFHLVTGEDEKQELVLTLTENLTQDETIGREDVALLAQAEGIEPIKSDRLVGRRRTHAPAEKRLRVRQPVANRRTKAETGR